MWCLAIAHGRRCKQKLKVLISLARVSRLCPHMTRFALYSGQSFVIAVTKLFEVLACVPIILLSLLGSQRQFVSAMTLLPAVGGYDFL